MSYRGLKFCVNTGYQTYISGQKMNKFRVPNRVKAIKKTSSGLIGSFNIKKIRNLFESSFFNKIFLLFLCFLCHLETSHFTY